MKRASSKDLSFEISSFTDGLKVFKFSMQDQSISGEIGRMDEVISESLGSGNYTDS